MKKRIKTAAERAAKNPVLRKSAQSLKPSQSIWGALGVILFFIVPEIIGFIWREELTVWAHAKTVTEPTEMGRRLYWLLEQIYKNGGSWINLSIGVLLLLWLFRDRRQSNKNSGPE